jgi:sugar lactone lactonase YvrE
VICLATDLRFPEGPTFAPDGSLWCVELKGGGLCRLQDGVLTRVATGGEPNGIAISADGRVWFCDAGQRSVRVHDPRDGSTRTVVDSLDGAPLGKPNDLAFDALGNLLFTCPNDGRTEAVGYVCCLDHTGRLTRIASDLYFANGLAFTADGAELVVAETYRQRLWRGRWDAASCRWHGRVWAEGLLGKPGPDGMAFATDGTLWAAVYGSGQIMAVDAAGSIVRRIDLPGRNPTNCAFDPSGRLGLVVTEAEQGQLLSLPELGRGIALFGGAA